MFFFFLIIIIIITTIIIIIISIIIIILFFLVFNPAIWIHPLQLLPPDSVAKILASDLHVGKQSIVGITMHFTTQRDLGQWVSLRYLSPKKASKQATKFSTYEVVFYKIVWNLKMIIGWSLTDFSMDSSNWPLANFVRGWLAWILLAMFPKPVARPQLHLQ